MDSFQTPLRYPRGLRPARAFFVFGGRDAPSFFVPGNAPKLRRNIPAAALSIMSEKWDNSGMETLLKTLEQIGVEPATIDAIRDAEDMESALILLMNDDRHEYVD